MIVFQNRLPKPGIIDGLGLASATASKDKQRCENDANANCDVSVERIHGAGLELRLTPERSNYQKPGIRGQDRLRLSQESAVLSAMQQRR
jgi:hypothetical protein